MSAKSQCVSGYINVDIKIYMRLLAHYCFALLVENVFIRFIA